jgi:glycosyltransferase involved in cell wall biosynthesis
MTNSDHITIVIPTWMEDRWLPRLLRSIGHPAVHHIIVADNSSTDNTARVAREGGCEIVHGGRPAAARNAGARLSETDITVFADADVVLSPSLIETLQRTFLDNPKTVAFHCRLRPIACSRIPRIAYRLLDLYIRGFRLLGVSQGVGSLIAVRTGAFRRIGGFDESLEAGEDVDLFRRISALGSVVYRSEVTAWVSPRRLYVENPVIFGLKTVLWAFLRLTRSQRSIMSYRWRPYPLWLAEHEATILDAFVASEVRHA